jgi:septation ring formation regulator EzrA
MNIQTRLAKLEGINKSRSEKLIQAKAKAKQLFGVDDAKSLRSLWEKVSSLEAQLSGVLSKSSEHLEVCVTKIENKVCLSEAEIQLTDEFSKKINVLKTLIKNAVSPCANQNEGMSSVDKSAENAEDTIISVPTIHRPQPNNIKFQRSSWELNKDKAVESVPEHMSTGMLSL